MMKVRSPSWSLFPHEKSRTGDSTKSGSGLTETGSHRHRRNYLANSLYRMGEGPQVNVFGSQLAARTVLNPVANKHR